MPWLKVVAASLGVTTDEVVCVMTDGATVSPRGEVLSNAEGSKGAGEATS